MLLLAVCSEGNPVRYPFLIIVVLAFQFELPLEVIILRSSSGPQKVAHAFMKGVNRQICVLI